MPGLQRTEYVPRRFGGSTLALSQKSLCNIWIIMCSFFTWTNSEFRLENAMKSVPVPRFQEVNVEPFIQDEIERMLKAFTYSREADTFICWKFVMRWPTSNRDQAIILTLLDSGIRASEFSSLRMGDFAAKRGKLPLCLCLPCFALQSFVIVL
jgi:integrase/recombinase XerD